MTDQEREQFFKAAEKHIKLVSSNKKAAQQFLVDIGIFTPKGNLRKPFKNLYLPQNPA
jgi:hypothetical protein